MKATIKQLETDLKKLKETINDLNYQYRTDELQVEHNIYNADELTKYYEYRRLFEQLLNIRDEINYLQSPIVAEGRLTKNEFGKYELNTKDYSQTFSCGCGIEYLVKFNEYDYEKEKDVEVSKWVASSIEHNGKDYYIVKNPKLKLNGLYVRVRYINDYYD